MRYNTAFISDLHLGSRNCNAQKILDFLHDNDFDKLYLVGDIIDFWALKRERYWPQLHNDVIQKILKKGRAGCEIIYLVGNHDLKISDYLGNYGNISIQENDIHVTESGERIFIFHGHQLDVVIRNAEFVAHLGDIAYTILMRCNRLINWTRSLLGCNYWSLSKFCKSKVKEAVNFVGNFEENVVKYSVDYNVDSVLCGHVHSPAIKNIIAKEKEWLIDISENLYPDKTVKYYNCGDFVESYTAIVEHRGGEIGLLYL